MFFRRGKVPHGFSKQIRGGELVSFPSLQESRRTLFLGERVIPCHEQALLRDESGPWVREEEVHKCIAEVGATCSWRCKAVGMPPVCSMAAGTSSLRRSHTRTMPSHEPLTDTTQTASTQTIKTVFPSSKRRSYLELTRRHLHRGSGRAAVALSYMYVYPFSHPIRRLSGPLAVRTLVTGERELRRTDFLRKKGTCSSDQGVGGGQARVHDFCLMFSNSAQHLGSFDVPVSPTTIPPVRTR